jgi:hypothetical protein
MKTLICHQCSVNGQTSSCRASRVLDSEYEKDKYWDEEGVYHGHSKSLTQCVVRCSQGHLFYWLVKKSNPCKKCDLGEEFVDRQTPTSEDMLSQELRNCDLFVINKDLQLNIK